MLKDDSPVCSSEEASVGDDAVQGDVRMDVSSDDVPGCWSTGGTTTAGSGGGASAPRGAGLVALVGRNRREMNRALGFGLSSVRRRWRAVDSSAAKEIGGGKRDASGIVSGAALVEASVWWSS